MTFISLYVQNLINVIVFIQKCPNLKCLITWNVIRHYFSLFYTISRTMKMIK